jgi:hypothetical protein
MFFILGILVAIIGYRVWQKQMSFRAQVPDNYAYLHPNFDLRHHLNGRFVCEGVVFGPLGRVTSRFAADVEATWTGDSGLMKEHFRYDSGATQDREWQLTLLEGGAVRAEAKDVVGKGEGRVIGSALQLLYRIRLPDDVGGHVLDVIDWMYLLENGTIVNRSQFRKFGFKVAELIATFRKKEK